MSLKRAFKAFFGDPDWLKKSALGMLGILVPYVGAVVVMGYGIEYMRDVAWREDDRLPEWRNLERYLKTGFGAFVVSLVYMLPVSLLLGLISIPVFILLATASDPGPLVVLLTVLAAFFSLPVSLLWSAFVEGAIIRFAAYDKIAEGLRVGEVLKSIRATIGALWGALWRVWVLSLAVGGVLTLGYGVVIGGVVAASLSGSEGAALASIPFLYCGEFFVMILAAAIGVPIQFVSYHVWGQYLAVAYPEQRFDQSASKSDPVAQYGAGHTVLPGAPGRPASDAPVQAGEPQAG